MQFNRFRLAGVFLIVLSIGAGGCVLAYLVLLERFPNTWAAANGVVFLLGSGFLTTRFGLGIRDFKAIALLTPIIGTMWIAFFWILYRFL